MVGGSRQEAMISTHDNTPDETQTATAEKTELISKLEARVAQLEKTVDARDAKVSSLNSQLTLVKFELTQHEERTKRRESKLKQAVRTMLDDAKARAEEVNLWRQSAAWKLEEATMGKRFAALEEVGCHAGLGAKADCCDRVTGLSFAGLGWEWHSGRGRDDADRPRVDAVGE